MDEKESILIVDDNESTCKSLTLVFGKKGYETETAGTGREAIEKARGRFFNLALLDIRLPDMEGIELIAPLKEIHPDLLVIMVTAYASLETAVRSLKEGASAYIHKPLNMDEVLATVREALEKQRLVMENRRLYEVAQQELTERIRAEEALQKANDELEQRVEERTAKLAKTTEQLEVELTERKRIEEERKKLIKELQDALAEVKTLSGLLPICSSCKKIRDDEGNWNHIEVYIRDRSEADFTHGICPECRKKLYPKPYNYNELQKIRLVSSSLVQTPQISKTRNPLK